jgi:hypothetical protein
MTASDLWQSLASVFGQIVAYSGIAALAAFGLFRFFGQKWIEDKFAQRLQEYRHEQAKELEDVRFRINSQFNRLTKLHEKEFDILPNVWGKLHDAYQATARCIIGFRQYPNLDQLSAEELEEFLAATQLPETAKARIRGSSEKWRLYADILSWIELDDAHKSFDAFHSYLVANRIFLHSDLKTKFDEIDTHMWTVWVQQKVAKDTRDHQFPLKEWQERQSKIQELMTQIETLVQTRLYPSEQLPQNAPMASIDTHPPKGADLQSM